MKIHIYWDILGTLYSTSLKWRDSSFVLFRLLRLASFVVIWKFRYFSDMRKGKLFFNIYEGRAPFIGFYLFVC
jgi:hypothetical protein